MDDAQKELDKGASTRGTEDDEDDDEGDEGGRDLLEGAEADAGGGRKVDHGDSSLLDRPMVEEPGRSSPVTPSKSSDLEKSTMFER